MAALFTYVNSTLWRAISLRDDPDPTFSVLKSYLDTVKAESQHRIDF
jgi:hypothetical protein